MTDVTAQKAISTALSGNWTEAIILNKKILQDSPKDTDALNRLARAYAEKGNYKRAKACAKKALNLDPLNSIAQKCLERWNNLDDTSSKKSKSAKASVFLEEPGKTKMVKLIHVGDKKVISSLDSGDEVQLETEKRKISVCTCQKEYVGRLTDDLSARLRELVKHGNQYEAFVKSVETDCNSVVIFIRETKRSSKLLDVPSFTTEKVEFVSLSRN